MPINDLSDLMEALKDGGSVYVDGFIVSGTFRVVGMPDPQESSDIVKEYDTINDPHALGVRAVREEEDDEWYLWFSPDGRGDGQVQIVEVDGDTNCYDVPSSFEDV